MSMRIGICGTQCSGKTTLAQFISDAQDLPFIADVAGKFTDRNTVEAQRLISIAQMDAEKMAGDYFISDRTIVDNMAYFQYVDKTAAESMQLAWDAHMQEHPYDLMIFVAEYFPLEDSPHREMDEAQQKWVHKYIIDNVYKFTKHYKIPLLTVFGSTKQRYAMLCDAWFKQYEYD